MSRRRARWWAAAALTVPVLILAAPFLFTSRCLYGLDFDHYYRSQAVLARESFENDGELPRWNPRVYAGTPFAGNPGFSLAYPPNWLFLVAPPEESFEILMVLHMLLATWGLYRLTRHFRLGRTACVLAGLAFGLSFFGTMRMWAGHMAHYFTETQAPLLLFLLLRLLAKPTLGRTAALGGWVGIVLLAGHPQFIYHLAFLCLSLTLWKLVTRLRGRETWWPAAAAVGGAALIGLAIAAVHLLPSIEVAAWSTREPGLSFYGKGRVSEIESVLPGDLAFLLIPTFPFSPSVVAKAPDLLWHEKAVYVGLLPLLLAVGALVARRRGPVLFFGIAGLVMLLDGMARHLPLHAVFSLVPGYGQFRVPARSIWMLVLSLSVLTSFGWEAISKGELSGRRLRWMLAAFGGAVLIAGLTLAVRFKIRAELLLLVAGAGAAAAMIRFAPGRPVLAVVFVAADLCFFGMSFQRTVSRDEYAAAPWYARVIGPERREHRLLDTTDFMSMPASHGFHLVDGFGYPCLKSTGAYYAHAWADHPGVNANSLQHGTKLADPAVLEVLGARWIVVRGPPLLPRWREIARDGDRILYEDPAARPLAFWMEGTGEVTSTRASANRIEVTGRSDRPRALVVSESWTPGWRATVNGAPADVGKAYDARLRLELPAGESHVTLVYDPASRRAGAVATLAGLVALAALLIAAALRRRRFAS